MENFHSAADIAVTTNTVVLEFFPVGMDEIFNFQVSNTGANPLTAFSFQVQVHPSAEWVTKLSAWAAAGSVLLFVSADFATLAAAAKASAQVRLDYVHGVRLVATSALGTTVSVCGISRGDY